MNKIRKIMAEVIAFVLFVSLFLFGCSVGDGHTAGNGGAETDQNPDNGAGPDDSGISGTENVSGSEIVSAADESAAADEEDDAGYEAESADDIHINQIGYLPDDIKQVFVNGKASQFIVINSVRYTRIGRYISQIFAVVSYDM